MEGKEMYIVNRDTLSRVGEGGRRHSSLDLCFSSGGLLNIIRYKQLDDT